MPLLHWATLIGAASPLLLMAGRLEAAPLPPAMPEIHSHLVSPACHRGWHHRTGRPCGYGYRYAPPADRYRYGVAPYGYGRQICRWRTDAWGRAVRVCRWR